MWRRPTVSRVVRPHCSLGVRAKWVGGQIVLRDASPSLLPLNARLLGVHHALEAGNNFMKSSCVSVL